MKSSRAPDPTRWRDRDTDASALESRAAALADAAGPVPPLGPEALSRIRTQVLAQRTGRRLFGFGRFSVHGRLAFGIGLVLVCVTTAGGASMLWRKLVRSQDRTTSLPVEKAPPQAPHRVSRLSSRGSDPEAALTPPSVDDDGAKPALPTLSNPPDVGAHPSPRPSSASAVATHESEPAVPLPQPAEAPPSAPPAKATEAGLVAEALSDLRQLNDPRAALATLDRYAQAFPHGVLETEAQRTRVEAVIQLGDLKTALALLEGKAALSEPLGPDLLLTRAELRAAAGRFREALADFNTVVDSAAGPLVAGGNERALYGRAVCLGRLAQDERARADLLAYQKRFPTGRFAAEVQRLLTGPAPSQHP
jgi:hypothetical protein